MSETNWTILELALYDWLTLASGIEFIFAHQDSPQPDPPYGTIYVTSDRQMGIKEKKFFGGEEEMVYIGPNEVSISLQTYGPGAMGYMRLVRKSIDKIGVRQLLMDAGLTILQDLPILDLSEELETGWQERGQMDIMCLTASEVSEQINRIDTTEVTYELNGQTLLTDTFIIGD